MSDLMDRAVATSQCNSPLGSVSLATSGVHMLEVVMPRFGIECYTWHRHPGAQHMLVPTLLPRMLH
jgi:hypothetical protein